MSGGHSGVSAVVLNRGARFPRRAFFAELQKAGFDSVLSVEGAGEHYDIDDLSASFPFVRFITLPAPVSVGEAVNIAAGEVASPLFFILWNDLKIAGTVTAASTGDGSNVTGNAAGNAETIAERIVKRLLLDEGKSANVNALRFKRLCTVPVFQNSRFELLPSAVQPVMSKKKLELARMSPEKENMPSLYPYNAVGIYDRQRFFDMGCFDTEIKSEYWQMLDFGFRAWLSGEEINTTHFIRLRYNGEEKVIDASYNEDYWRFFFKNLSPELKKNRETGAGCAHLPLKYLIPFLFKVKDNPFDAAKLFFSAKKWVHSRRASWKMSAKDLILNW